MSQLDYQKIVDECNQECRKCKADFEKAGLNFDPHGCSLCANGMKLHEALTKISQKEKEWGDQNWNSSKLKRFYHG